MPLGSLFRQWQRCGALRHRVTVLVYFPKLAEHGLGGVAGGKRASLNTKRGNAAQCPHQTY